MIQFDADKLTDALMELEPKRRMRALKSSLFRAANKVRKRAIENLRSERSGIASRPYADGRSKTKKHAPGKNPNPALEKGIKSIVYRKRPAFRVTVGTKKGAGNGKGERGMHINRQGLKKPVLMWAESGTKPRNTKTKTRNKKKGHFTGSMPAMRFMDKTKAEMAPGITDLVHEAMEKSIMQALKKYGK